jgi:hypothetical protein
MTYKFLHLQTFNGALDNDNSLEMSIKMLTHHKSTKIWLIHVSATHLAFVSHGTQNSIMNMSTFSRQYTIHTSTEKCARTQHNHIIYIAIQKKLLTHFKDDL